MTSGFGILTTPVAGLEYLLKDVKPNMSEGLYVSVTGTTFRVDLLVKIELVVEASTYELSVVLTNKVVVEVGADVKILG